MDPLKKSILDAEKLREQLPALREDPSVEGMVKYNEVLLEATERQHNIYTRLRLMGDPESKDTADEMERVAGEYLGKPDLMTMDEFFMSMTEEIQMQLALLAPADLIIDIEDEEDDEWPWF